MSRHSSPLDKQNELIRSLRQQLQAKERELGEQKWLLEQYLKSPSWRFTSPIRWLVRQARALRNWLVPQPPTIGDVDSHPHDDELQLSDSEPETPPIDLKEFLTDLYRIQLQSFLTSNATLELPQSDDPEISVILVLFNRAELTLACLRSLAENRSERLQIIIVDNNSQDQTPLLLDRLHGACVIRNGDNRNFLLAVNQGAQEARGEYLLLLNNDAQVLPGTLRSTLNTIRSASDIGGVGGRLILLDGTLQEAGSIVWRDGSCLGYGRGDNPFAPMYMFRRDVDYCSGAFLLTPRRIWEELHGFDERFKPAYYEETDYCARLWEHDLRVVYDPHSILLHYEFASSESVTHATDLQRDHQRIFAARHQHMLAEHFAPDPNSIVYARMKDRGNGRVMFIDDRVPHVWLGSGFPRARAILLAMLKRGCIATFYPLTEFAEEWTSVYSDIPTEVEVMIGYGPPLLEAFLRSRKSYYHTIFVSRPHNMKILKPVIDAHPEWFEQTEIIYDAEAIFASREITFRELTGVSVTPEEADALVVEEVELASMADCVVGVSERDAEQFRKHNIDNVRVIGHSLVPSPTPNEFEGRAGFLFVGAIHEEASPNGDSVIWFLEQVFPKIQAILNSKVCVTIAGVNKSEHVKGLAGPLVNITGHLSDLTMLYNSARVFIAPTRYAAGIPHKVHEAAAYGVPVVGTPLIASQLGWTDGDCILVGSDPEEFADRCIQLYQDSNLWSKVRQAALDRVTRECSTEVFEQSVAACLRQSLEAVKQFRA